MVSESSYEDNRLNQVQIHERALHAVYHLAKMNDGQYGVITLESRCETKDQEYIIYRFVGGLERIPEEYAVKAVKILNDARLGLPLRRSLINQAIKAVLNLDSDRDKEEITPELS